MPCPSTLITMIDFPITKNLEWFGQPAAVAGHDSLDWRTPCDDAQPRHAARLSSWAVRAQPRPNLSSYTNAYISTLRGLSTDILSFRDSLRYCLRNTPPTLQQRWRVQPDPILRQHPPICHTLTHMGTRGGHLQGHKEGEWDDQGGVWQDLILRRTGEAWRLAILLGWYVLHWQIK